ncbi:MAG: multidrug efflux SMR transporter [Pseudomonadales bacterium]|nr:multidrug efflux SMR transporter [Pseudomonadales bacterium]
MAWIYLIIAGLMEIVWALALKQSQQFTQLTPTIVFLISASISIIFLGLALKTIPIGTAYAVWTGIGAVGVAIAGMVLLNDPVTIIRLMFIGLIVCGVIGLKVSAGQ